MNALSVPPIRKRELSPMASPHPVPHSPTPEPSPDDPAVWQVKISSFRGTLASFFSNLEIQIATPGDRKRFAEISLFVPEANIVSEHSTLKEHKMNAKILPYTHTVSQSIWAELQKISKLDLSNLRDPDSLADTLLRKFGVHGQSNSYKPPVLTNSPSPLLIYKLHRPIQVSEVLRIQLTAS